MCAIERNIKLRDYKKWLKTSQIENITNYLKKKKTDSVNEIKKYKKVILKTQQRFKSEGHVFPEEINEIPLSLNYDKKCN